MMLCMSTSSPLVAESRQSRASILAVVAELSVAVKKGGAPKLQQVSIAEGRPAQSPELVVSQK